MKCYTGKKSKTHLPILVSSSNSDGDRLVRRHKAAIIPTCKVKQQTKSIMSRNSRTPPTATAIIDADDKILPSLTRITKSLPKNINPKGEITRICVDFQCKIVV